jgi:GTPase
MARGTHPFPSRTRPLSPAARMVLLDNPVGEYVAASLPLPPHRPSRPHAGDGRCRLPHTQSSGATIPASRHPDIDTRCCAGLTPVLIFSNMCSPANLSNPLEAETRSGYVTLVGRPNAGKSTLLNALIGERLSIVTPKAQTTWRRVTGILTSERAQMIFLDTPGLLQPRDLLQEAMLATAREAIAEADLILLVLDASQPGGSEEMNAVEGSLADRAETPLISAINKIDLAREEHVEALSGWVSERLRGKAFPVSALKGIGMDALASSLEDLLPHGPFLFPPEDIASDPVRFFVAEFIRETVFEEFHQEIPYSAFCQVEEFREGQDPIYIQANLFVERESQKRILIGRQGSSIRRLGAVSRGKIEEFLGRRVYLDLWIKVLPDWRKKRAHLKRFGFTVPTVDSPRDKD